MPPIGHMDSMDMDWIWVSIYVIIVDWVGLGHRVDGLDWIGFTKLDPRPTLCQITIISSLVRLF